MKPRIRRRSRTPPRGAVYETTSNAAAVITLSGVRFRENAVRFHEHAQLQHPQAARKPRP